MTTPTLTELAASHFRPLLAQSFDLELAAGDHCAAQLVEVHEGAPLHPSLPRSPFVLLFQTTRAPLQCQGAVFVTHPALGRLELFMTAVAPSAVGQRFEVVFA